MKTIELKYDIYNASVVHFPVKEDISFFNLISSPILCEYTLETTSPLTHNLKMNISGFYLQQTILTHLFISAN
jgi:hypothetical protein